VSVELKYRPFRPHKLFKTEEQLIINSGKNQEENGDILNNKRKE